MNKKIKSIIYFFIIIIMFIITDKILYLFPNKGKNEVINNVLLLENKDLKEKLNELTYLNYHNYDYEIGKITYKNIYDSNSYFIEYNSNFDNNIVLNDKGMIGIVNNHILTLVKDLSLSIKINDNYGILKDNKISIIKNNYNIGDEIYTSGLTDINNNYLIGYIKDIKDNDIENIIEIDYIPINTSYVVILK